MADCAINSGGQKHRFALLSPPGLANVRFLETPMLQKPEGFRAKAPRVNP
jgi:hypothetical protein